MKIIIEIEEDGLSSMELLENDKEIIWQELTKNEQYKILNSLMSFYQLFNKCKKE